MIKLKDFRTSMAGFLPIFALHTKNFVFNATA